MTTIESSPTPDASPYAAPTSETMPPAPTHLASPWRRIGAIAIDGILLGVVGTALGWALFDSVARLGSAARGIGFVLAWVYFGLGNSRLSGGATLGKRLLGIRVVTIDGEPVGVGRSLLRSVVYLLPYFLNNLTYTKATQALIFPSSIIIFGVGGAVLYLLLFNRATRQSLHDLMTRTFVIHLPWRGRPEASPWPGHILIGGGIFAVATVGALFSLSFMQSRVGSVDSLLEAQEQILRDPRFCAAQVTASAGRGTGGSYRKLSVEARAAARPETFDTLVDDAARAVFDSPVPIDRFDYVEVKVVYGFDLGIASSSQSQVRRATVADWRGQLSESKAPSSEL